MSQTVVIGAARTPFGSYGGSLKNVPAVELGAVAVREAVRRSGVDPGEIDYAFMGMVVPAGQGQIPGRQATIKAGLSPEVPVDQINKVCASSLRAANLADVLIRTGEIEIAVAGGMENMSHCPYVLEKARWGYRMGDAALVDAMVRDGLWCPTYDCHMGVHGSDVAKEYGITREEQDAWALRSHRRAIAAIDEGRMAEEVVPVPVPQRKGPPVEFAVDEHPRRDTSLEKLAKLPPVFQKDGTVTAGNAPGLNDGAAAVVLTSEERARALGVRPMARIVSQGWVSVDSKYLNTVPALAARQAIDRAGLGWDDIKLIEANEAFAAVALTSAKIEGWDPEKVNVNGGAIALGHPIGASGARILLTLIYELRRRGGGYGVATICSGMAQGEATVVHVEP